MDPFGADRTTTQELASPPRNNGNYIRLGPSSHVLNGQEDMSENGSSSLSELEDVLEDNEAEDLSDGQSSDEPDTEAETERLEISPQKLRKHTNTNSEALAIDAMMNMGSAEVTQPTLADLAAASVIAAPTEHGLGTRSSSSGSSSGTVNETLTDDPLGRKRKRTSSIARIQQDLSEDGAPFRKRSSSARFGIRSQDIRTTLQDHDDDDADSAVVGDASDEEELDPVVPLDEVLVAEPMIVSNRTKHESVDEEDDSDKDLAEPIEEDVVTGSKVDHILEVDEAVGADLDDEEPDAAAKSEDEMAKKKTAMDALKPIEKLFAIFRDKLFDERLSKLSDELEQLNQPIPTHPEFLAQRLCLDSRRDEKIHLEQINLQYKVQALERITLADRSQLHSQYFQSVREIRESHMYKLNKHFSAIQRERRHLKGKETQFVYNFNPKLSVQVSQQTAYNKEVSLLSGMARYVGFPAAPEIQGPSNEDIEADLRAMKVNWRYQY